MELHAYTRTISDLFSVKKKYIVPRFQREYSWTKEQISELWDDIISNISINKNGNNFHHSEYFIGALVLVGEDKSTSLQIVDGQQRLTTLTILLAGLCERFKKIGKENIAKAIYNNYMAGKDDNGEDYFKLENETPKPFFQTSIQHINKQEEQSPTTTEEKTLLDSYKELYDYTSKDYLRNKFPDLDLDDNNLYEELLKAIRDQVVNHLKVIFITVAEEDEAYTIFETLNARGISLSFVDLIKNKIFKDLKKKHPDDSAKTKWKKLRQTLGSRDSVGTLEIFIRDWWISRYSYVGKQKVYKAFKSKLNSGDIDSEKLLDDLVEDAQLYIKIAAPSADDWRLPEEKQVYRSLQALRIFNVSLPRPFVISLIKAKNTKIIKVSDIESALSFIEKFHFLFTAICSQRPSGIEGSYSTAARQLFEAQDKENAKKTISDLKDKLKVKIPDIEVFKLKFNRLKYSKGYTKDRFNISLNTLNRKSNRLKNLSQTILH